MFMLLKGYKKMLKRGNSGLGIFTWMNRYRKLKAIEIDPITVNRTATCPWTNGFVCWGNAMATVQSPNCRAVRAQLRNAAADLGPYARGPSPSVVRTLAFEGRKLLGAVLLLFGVLMMSTLLLLPVGLPLALLAVALIAAPNNT
jgi:hypothetical protein